MKGRGQRCCWEVFLFRNVEAVEIKHQKSLEKRLSLLLCGGGSSAGQERARIGEHVAKK